jgi:hypothetical protein
MTTGAGMTTQRWTHESGERLSRHIACWAGRTVARVTTAVHRPRRRNSSPTSRPRREPTRRSHIRCGSPWWQDTWDLEGCPVVALDSTVLLWLDVLAGFHTCISRGGGEIDRMRGIGVNRGRGSGGAGAKRIVDAKREGGAASITDMDTGRQASWTRGCCTRGVGREGRTMAHEWSTLHCYRVVEIWPIRI